MALRSLDNTLPITPERPKKLAKVVITPIPLQKPSDSSTTLPLNDENKAPLPATNSGDPAFDYVSSEDLRPIPEPETKLQSLMEGLESKDWTKVCESLNNARRFVLYHSNLLLPALDKVMLVLVKAMKNPRSALCKTSIMAASDIFNGFGHNLLQSSVSDAFDHLLLQLLLKASQDKRFVCEEADKSLHAMVGSTPPLPLLRKLRAYASHTNPRVRAKAAVCISHCVSRMGLEEMREFGMVLLLGVAASLMNDRLPEAREAARRTVGSVYGAFAGDEEKKSSEQSEQVSSSPVEKWHRFCCESLPTIQAQCLLKMAPSAEQ